MPKGQRKYNGTQKVEIIERIRSEQLSFHEASREYDVPRRTLQDWERIYLEEVNRDVRNALSQVDVDSKDHE